MNYKRIHDSIITNAQKRIIPNEYYEKHHIIPRCMGGNNSEENLVNLTAKEHYIIHRLLTKIYPSHIGLNYAFWMMCTRGKYKPSLRAYEEGKILAASTFRKRVGTKEAIKKMKKSKKGQKSWLGKKHSEDSKIKQSNSAKDRKTTIKGETERRRGISKSNKGKKKSPEHVENIRKAKLGSNNPMFGKKYKIINGKRVFYE